MKSALPVVAAGGSFAGASIGGLALGIWIADRTGQQLWVVLGLGIGLAIGAYAAIRLVLRALQ